jgi:hypothetical protein
MAGLEMAEMAIPNFCFSGLFPGLRAQAALFVSATNGLPCATSYLWGFAQVTNGDFGEKQE